MYTVLAILLFVLAFLNLLGVGHLPTLIGQPRPALTESQVGGRILLNLLFIAVFVWAGILLVLH
jgi:hypothetical protein